LRLTSDTGTLLHSIGSPDCVVFDAASIANIGNHMCWKKTAEV